MNKSEVRSKKTFSIFTNIPTKTCKFCAKIFRDKSSCGRHEAHCQSKENHWICEKCSKTFKTENGLISHKTEHDDSVAKSFKCSTCLKAYKSLSDLRKHCEMYSHIYPAVEGPVLEHEIRCTVCYRIVKTSLLEFHMQMRHKTNKMIKCERCDYSTMRKNHYLRHIKHKHGLMNTNFDVIRKHFENNECYVCSKCSKVFETSETAEDHLVLKNCEDEDKLICKICNIKFTMIQNQRAHMKRKHKE